MLMYLITMHKDSAIESSKCGKPLDVTIVGNFSSDNHINICPKTSQRIDALSRVVSYIFDKNKHCRGNLLPVNSVIVH